MLQCRCHSVACRYVLLTLDVHRLPRRRAERLALVDSLDLLDEALQLHELLSDARVEFPLAGHLHEAARLRRLETTLRHCRRRAVTAAPEEQLCQLLAVEMALFEDRVVT